MPTEHLDRRSFMERLTTAFAAAALAFPSTLYSQGKDHMMGTNDLTGKASIRIRRSPSDVFSAFADARSMSAFWFHRRDDGLKEGESVTWYMGSGENAYAFDVDVREITRPTRIVIEWDNGGDRTQVVWSMEATAQGDTILTIEESGFTGSNESILNRAIDSTAGFNQVIVAAKAFIEHGIALNVVADHG